VSDVLIGVLSALLATNQPAAVSNLVTQTTGLTLAIPDPNDPIEKEYHKLTADDDAALSEVDGWIRENNAFAEKGGGMSDAQLNSRIRERFAPVKKAYEDFLQRHPDHARAHLAYGSFLEDARDEDAAAVEYEKARCLDPKNPAPWNQLANHYVHEGPVKKSFEYYAKAIELDPTEPLYYRNLGNTVFLFRKDAKEFYNIDEQAVFSKALDLLQHALKLDPNNFELATDVAKTYYGVRPVRTDEALSAWTNALNIAGSEVEREGIYIHLARFKLNADRFAEAHRDLDIVTNSIYNDLKNRLLRNLALRENPPTTNAVPAKSEIK
jgi:tetratricopeptide (TPR) repeat protein